MKISDLFSQSFIQASKLLSDLVRFIFQPRTYFAMLQQENLQELVRRFAFYLVAFHLITYSLFSVAFHSDRTFDQFSFLGIVLLDFASALLFVPALMLTTIFCSKTSAFRNPILYALTFKVVYALIPILLYVFFLISENYSVAMARGISVYMFMIAYVLLFPILFSTGLRNRILAVLTSVLGAAVTLALIAAFLASGSMTLASLEEYNVLYDPIGRDVDQVINFVTHREEAKPLEFVKKYFGYPAYQIEVSTTTSMESWKNNRRLYLAQLEHEDSVFVQFKASQRFNTCKTLIDLKREEIKALFQCYYAMDVVFDIDEKMDLDKLFKEYKSDSLAFFRRPELPKELEHLAKLRPKMDEYFRLQVKSYGDAIEAHRRFISEANKIQDFRLKLIRVGLLL